MEYERLDFVEAVEVLAHSLGLEVPREDQGTTPQTGANDDILDMLAAAERYFRAQLKLAPEAIAYLKQRGLSGETAAQFGLGYAPDRWDGLLGHLGAAQAGVLERAGLVIKRDQGGYYDRFRGRVMFPIRDRRGRTIGFGGRVMGQGEPKYLNSPETPVFHKGRELYGLYEARKGAARLDRILVVEGYMDVIALAQAGITNVVATLGTATTHEHLDRLFRVTGEVIFCFDGDAAGRRAAWRALETTMPTLRDGRAAYFLFLPEGEDPDSLVREEGRDAFLARVGEATGIAEFMLQELTRRHDTATAAGRARLAEEARGLIAQLAEGVLRDQILVALSRMTGLEPAQLAQRLAPSGSAEAAATPSANREHPIRITPMRKAIALLLANPELGSTVTDTAWLGGCPQPGAGLLQELLETLRGEPQLSTAALLERWRGREEERHLARLLEEPGLDAAPEVRQREFEDALARLHLKQEGQRAEALLEKSRSAPLSPAEKDELRRLLVQLQGRRPA
jgi:DNA primase